MSCRNRTSLQHRYASGLVTVATVAICCHSRCHACGWLVAAQVSKLNSLLSNIDQSNSAAAGQRAGNGDPNWLSQWDPAQRKIYYYHRMTGATQWDKPAQFIGGTPQDKAAELAEKAEAGARAAGFTGAPAAAPAPAAAATSDPHKSCVRCGVCAVCVWLCVWLCVCVCVCMCVWARARVAVSCLTADVGGHCGTGTWSRAPSMCGRGSL